MNEELEVLRARQAKALAALRKHGGNVSRAARAIGIPRQTFYRYRKEDADFRREMQLTLDDCEVQRAIVAERRSSETPEGALK